MIPRTRLLSLVPLAACCLAVVEPAPAAFEIKDEGKFFSADAVRKSDQRIKEIKEQSGNDLLIETFAEIPADRKKDYKAEDRNRFFEAWAKDRLKALGVDGVYVLVCREPAHFHVLVSEEARKKAISTEDRNRLRDQLLKS